VKRMSAYLMLGIRSAMPVIPAMMLPWEIMTPLGMPVEPLVYMMTAMSEGSGFLRFTATAEQRVGREVANTPTLLLVIISSYQE